jgi:ABC-type nitrate/sulfonate/bicarbonate transport system substrate-binding protein
LGIPYQDTTVFARRSYVNQQPEVVEKILTAIVQAIDFIRDPANKTAVMRSPAKSLRLPKPEDTADGYEIIETLYERKIYPTADGIRNIIRLLGAKNSRLARGRSYR